jgi:N-acetylglutamate synthase-like GNAT family acetyltransferase
MYARDAKKHEEVWLLDRLDEFGFEDPAFRSRDYVLAVDEDTNERAGFARFRVHAGEPSVCEFTNIGVLEDWRNHGVGAHLLEHLVDDARSQGFDEAYSLTDEGEYLQQFGFEPVSEAELPDPLPERLEKTRDQRPDAEPFHLDFGDFEIPDRLRSRFSEEEADTDEEPPESAEDFGIDPDQASYKYDTGS